MLKLYNTLTRQKEEFKPIRPGRVGVYSCGPTVYWNQHIGHMYAYIQWDVLIRALKYQGLETEWVMNITDVGHLTSDEDAGEDKMEKGARREGLAVWEVADKYTAQFLESMDFLNINRPDVLCRATGHIKEQINLIQRIEANGFTYRTKTGLVFDTSKFPDYSKFAHLDLDKQQAGARVEIDPEKRQPWDFLLWVTNQPKHIMQWGSPWGKGFPGWHIECTAMSAKYLGEKFDIHTGGIEHIPVHHTNEVAQAYGAFGSQTANYWLHNGWLVLKDEKMSKSLGNMYLVTDLIEKGYDPLAFRYLCFSSHYRKGLNFTWEGLEAAQTALKKLRNVAAGPWPADDEARHGRAATENFRSRFEEAINDDLNMPQALAVVWDLVKAVRGGVVAHFSARSLLQEFDKVLGLDLLYAPAQTIPQVIKQLVKEREEQRSQGHFDESDQLRQKILGLGYTVEDTSDGPKVKKI